MSWFKKAFRITSAAAILIWMAAAIFLAENASRIPPKARTPQLAHTAQATIRAFDGIKLRAWTREPKSWNGKAVILLHGVGDSHTGTAAVAAMLVRNGYRTLSPDSRGHGSSEGDRFGYGVLEQRDVRQWIDWIEQNWHPAHITGHGASMGAAILLQTMPHEPRLKAIVADCPFATFRRVAYHRVIQAAGQLMAPSVEPALLYTRLRFQIDLSEASPEEAMRKSSTPVLLIHGERDSNIPITHAERLYDAREGRNCALWRVPEAAHVASFGVAPQEYEERTLRWFEQACR